MPSGVDGRPQASTEGPRMFMRQLQATTPENVEALKQRLAELNDRLSG